MIRAVAICAVCGQPVHKLHAQSIAIPFGAPFRVEHRKCRRPELHPEDDEGEVVLEMLHAKGGRHFQPLDKVQDG